MGAILGYLPKLKHSSSFSAEDIGLYLNIKVDQVRLSLHRLNLKGLVTQKSRSFAHDTNRAPFFWGSDSGWASNVYYLRTYLENNG
jgi:predicted ArsR family transcriptional regulator